MNNTQHKCILFDGSSAACESVLALWGGPNPAFAMWKSNTTMGGYLKTKLGFVEFSRGDWIIMEPSGELHVCTEDSVAVARKAGVIRDLMYAWMGEEATEGKLVELTGLDRVALRTIKDDLVRRGVERVKELQGN